MERTGKLDSDPGTFLSVLYDVLILPLASAIHLPPTLKHLLRNNVELDLSPFPRKIIMSSLDSFNLQYLTILVCCLGSFRASKCKSKKQSRSVWNTARAR